MKIKIISLTTLIIFIIITFTFFSHKKESNSIMYIEKTIECNAGGYNGFTITNMFETLEKEFSFDDVLKLEEEILLFLNNLDIKNIDNKEIDVENLKQCLEKKNIEILDFKKNKNIVILKIGRKEYFIFIQAIFIEDKIIINMV